MYWDEGHKYYCVELIERKNSEVLRDSNLYTFDKNDPLRKSYLKFIPSYYAMSILPDYYEHLISDTLELYNKKGVYPCIRTIKLSYEDKKVVYLEEFIIEGGIVRSYGVILDQQDDIREMNKHLSYFRKKLRSALDSKKDLKEILGSINPHFKDDRWKTILDKELNKIGEILDSNADFEFEV
ncbi:MAG: hypothetical protein ACFFG0_13270 [Candidatus Thorarchaeota archaeon]